MRMHRHQAHAPCPAACGWQWLCARRAVRKFVGCDRFNVALSSSHKAFSTVIVDYKVMS